MCWYMIVSNDRFIGCVCCALGNPTGPLIPVLLASISVPFVCGDGRVLVLLFREGRVMTDMRFEAYRGRVVQQETKRGGSCWRAARRCWGRCREAKMLFEVPISQPASDTALSLLFSLFSRHFFVFLSLFGRLSLVQGLTVRDTRLYREQRAVRSAGGSFLRQNISLETPRKRGGIVCRLPQICCSIKVDM